MTNNYTIEKSIVTIPYVSNRDDRTVLFTDAGTINKVVAASNEGTVYFTKNSTEHIILTGTWFDEEPEVSPLHLIKENGKWILNNTEDLTLGYINGPKFLNDEKDVVFPDQGLEVGSPPFAGNHIRIASIDENNSIVWTQVSEKQAFYHCIAIHDIDNNGLNDILAVSFDEFFIWKQTEEDVFEQTNIINAGRMSAIGIADLDGDNEPEMILGSYVAAFGYKTEFTIYSDNLENLTTADELVPIFTYTLEDQSMGIESFKFDDFDNNGFKDIIVSTESGADRKIIVFMNDGDYNFRKTTTIDMPLSFLSHGGYELIDADKDGDKDLIINGLTGSEYNNSSGNLTLENLIYINDSGNFSKYHLPIVVEGQYWYQSYTKAFEINGELVFLNIQSQNMPELEITEIRPTIQKASKYNLSKTLDTSESTLQARSDEVASGTLNFNEGNNIIILDGQAKTYRGLMGDDTYFVSQFLPKNGKVSITDTEGSNLIQIPSNTFVEKSLFTKNAARLTLEDGREITINSADKFSYNVAGNITDGKKGTDLTYTEFAEAFGVYDILESSSAQTGIISDMYII
jgi:hypothetical protein|tara:strand:+ start:56 stop:1771 length:1716 start_codon:yes stop_codon:yes gene_type:complete